MGIRRKNTNRSVKGTTRYPVSAKNYLEIYIRQDGLIMLTPLTSGTLPVIQKISGNKKPAHLEYCG